MAPVPVVHQPEHRKARRTAEVIGADRVLPATAQFYSRRSAGQQLDGADLANPVFGLGAILALTGRAAHREAVRRLRKNMPNYDITRKSRPVVVIPYQSQWVSDFTQIAGRIRDVVNDAAIRIDHIGSTAIPGLAAAVVGTRLYLMSNRGYENEFVQALSTENGKPIWTTRVGAVGNANDFFYSKARSTPTVDGDFIYALGSDGDLVCLETQSGKLRWQKNIKKDFDGKPGIWAYAESPLLDGAVVVVTPGGAQATLVALNKKTGAVIWKSAVPSGDAAAYASAIVVQEGGRKQYVQFLSQGIVGVDAKTGAFLWRYKEAVKGMAQMVTPVARDGYVYGGAHSVGGGLVRLKSEGAGVVAEQVYFARGLPYSIGGSVLLGAYLYGTTGKGLVAVEFATGKVKWQAESIGSGSIAYADGHLYLHGENGDVALVEATPEGYREKGRFTPPAQPTRKRQGPFPEKAWTYPVIANGRLYIRDIGTLWAYDIKAGR